MAEARQSQTGYAEVNGTRLYYEVAGHGPPLILMHAGIADSRMWDDQFDVFAQHYRVVRYDLRGFGHSNPAHDTFSHRTDLYELLRFLQIERAALIGVSMSGSTVIDFTLEHPEMVTALIPVCGGVSGMSYESEDPPIVQELIAADQAGDLDRVNEFEVKLWIDGIYRSPEEVNAAVRDKVRDMNGIALQKGASGTGRPQQLEPPAADRLSEINVPTLVIVGDLDLPETQEAARLMMDQIPGAREAVIENAAHLPNMERPDEFNRVVLEFLAGLPGTEIPGSSREH